MADCRARGVVARVGALVLVGLMLLPGCQGHSGARLESRDEGSGGTVGGAELGRYMAFMREKQASLRRPKVSEAERRVGERALLELLAWLHGKTEEQLSREEPEDVFLRFKVERGHQGREVEVRDSAVDEKLEEYWRWARARSQWLAARHFRKTGRQWLLTESPVFEGAQDALTSAVLSWAYAHTQDPDFLQKSPQEVAVYLLVRRSALATALALGNASSPHLDYVPEPLQQVPADELLLELVVGLLPGIGEGVDLAGVVTGLSLLGHELTPDERLLCLAGAVLPILSGAVLAHMMNVERAALLTGRSLREAQVLQRVVQHLAPGETERVQRLLRAAGRGEKVSREELAWLRGLAKRLRGPLAEVAEAVRAGARVPLVGSRTTAEGMRLVPGSSEHLAQAWVDYQFRHPGKYPRFSYVPDKKWERMYRTVLENLDQGGEFEHQVLKTSGYEKNTALMMPPPGSREQGFIPDSVVGNPEELVWGRPYRFIEVKGREEMALTGNLKSMIEYVRAHGGHVEMWFRSARHSSGQTQLSGPLLQRIQELGIKGQAQVRWYP